MLVNRMGSGGTHQRRCAAACSRRGRSGRKSVQQQEDGSIGGPGFAIKNTDAVDRGLAVVGDHRRCLDGRLCTGGCGRRYGRKKREVRWQGRPTAPDRGSQVRSRLAAGGRWIRTIGTASESCLDFGKSVHLAEIFASQDATSGCGRSRLRSLRFARASSVGWQRTTRWMALRRELCVSRQGIQRSDLS